MKNDMVFPCPDFILITEIIPVSSNNQRCAFLKIIPILFRLDNFKNFYDVKLKLIRKKYPEVARLDFCYYLLNSPYLN